MALAEGKIPAFVSVLPGAASAEAVALRERAAALRKQAGLSPQQNKLRALYTGGTFCYEAQWLLGDCLGEIRSNAPAGVSKPLADPFKSVGNTIVDLGDDVFTRGKPHPMIDPTPRNGRVMQEMADPSCGVLLLDVVLGYGSHEDPAGELAAAIAKGRAASATPPVCIASVCGTDQDPQRFSEQCAKLEAQGVVLCQSNAQAVALAACVLMA